MRFNNLPNPIIVIVGPTGVGKTEVSLRLAETIQAEIISTDSRLFYRGMDIGTAKPSLAERARIPHHLIDVLNPDQFYSLALFQQDVHTCIKEIYGREHIPLLVGGTGQYVHAVMEGWEIPPQPSDEVLRDVITRWGEEIGAEELHRRLKIMDPEAAAVIQWQNLRRTVRALEVIFRTGYLFSDQRRKIPSPYSVLQIGLIRSREDLYRRIDERIEAMFAEGFLEEVQKLLDAGYRPDLPALSAIGYREAIQVLRKEIHLEEAKSLMRRYTRDYVRRQANWFKINDPLIHWFDAGTVQTQELVKAIETPSFWIPAGC